MLLVEAQWLLRASETLLLRRDVERLGILGRHEEDSFEYIVDGELEEIEC